jgi:hypothetical protein
MPPSSTSSRSPFARRQRLLPRLHVADDAQIDVARLEGRDRHQVNSTSITSPTRRLVPRCDRGDEADVFFVFIFNAPGTRRDS